MITISNIGKLQITATLTMMLIFGVIAGIMGLVLWYSGLTGFAGIAAALIFSIILIGIQWYIGPSLIKWMTRMKEVTPSEQPQLYEIVERISKIAGIPTPKLYIVYDGSPNAFAFGRTQKSAGIAVHTGLLNTLDKKEVEGVIAHEIGHIKHNDVIVMTIASVLPVLLYYLVLVLGNKDSRNKSFVQMLFVFFGAMMAQLFGRLIVMWLSRTREYYADAFSAYATENPTALMRGLAKITYGLNLSVGRGYEVNQTMRAFYVGEPTKENIADIANALELNDDSMLEAAMEAEKGKTALELFSTHPLTVKRIGELNKIRKKIGK